jgi:hypothetical protein
MQNSDFKNNLIDAITAHATGNIAKAKANVHYYFNYNVVDPSRPDIVGNVVKLLDEIAVNENRLLILQNHFPKDKQIL